jgi:hypothetical protein
MATDAQLNNYASALILTYLDTYFTSTTVTDYIDGGGEYLFTSKAPIISITSITDTSTSTVLSADTYDFYPGEGMIYRDDGVSLFSVASSNRNWGVGKRRFLVVYEAGHTSIPDEIALATALLITELRNRPDISVSSLELGDYKVMYREAGSLFTPEIKAILDLYKVRKA